MRRVLVALGVAWALAGSVSACAGASGGAARSPRSSLRGAGALGRADPTVMGAHLVPQAIDEDKSLGAEPGGGVRLIAAGVRVVSLPNGAVLAAEDRLPQAPSATQQLPERLGGGFLFVLGNVVWRAERWLAPARPLFATSTAITRVVIGLDRVYLRVASGATQAIDPARGVPLDPGAWPPAPFVGEVAAADGWRAVAVTDLRGAIATFDAGASWKPLSLPIDPRHAIVLGDSLAVGGADITTRADAWFEVRADGQVGRIAAPAKTPSAEIAPTLDPLAKPFGKRPLLAAIEDGWPLADGTAVVARDGALARVRIRDGALADLAVDAFPLKPSRCHPVSLARPSDPGAFGFVCGEPRAATILYAYDAPAGRVTELRRFDEPRMVLTSGNGAIAVRGGCARSAPADDEDRAQQSYCLLPRDGGWREVRLRGDIGAERVAVLGDGRLAIVSPPRGDIASARLTVLDGGATKTTVLAFPTLSPEVARVLRDGVWLHGIEERRKGVLGGWIEHMGSVLGYEIELDGKVRLGQFLHDAGAPMVSGRYGLGWTASRRGYETIDGGMTWTPLDLPEPIGDGAPGASAPKTAQPPRPPQTRACGPIGCMMAGWIRVGWGAARSQPPAVDGVASQKLTYKSAPALTLACEPTRGAPPPVPTVVLPPRPNLPDGPVASPWAGLRPAALATLDWSPLYSSAPPPLRADDLGLSIETSELLDRGPRTGPVARFYAWGARGSEWETTSRWVARWIWPYASSQEVHASPPVAAPRVVIESSRFATGGGVTRPVASWAVEPGDDAQHALLIARRMAPTDAVPFELASDRPPTEIRRADGEPFGEVEAAVRAGGKWFIASTQNGGELPATVVWEVDAGVARELFRAPRAGGDGSKLAPVRLARRSDGRALGVVVEGQPNAERSTPLRWVLGIDIATGAALDLEPLGASDLADRPAIDVCGGDEPGWVLDTTWSGVIQLHTSVRPVTALRSVYARLRLSRERACIERIAGTVDASPDGLSRRGAEGGRGGARGDAPSLEVSALAAHARYSLRCVKK